MKKLILYIIIVFFYSKSIIANEIKVIELHAKKSLDQLVLESDDSLENIENNEINSEILLKLTL